MTTANMMWGLMSPISKMVLITSIITPFIIVEIRIIGAAILFWIASIFTKREHVSPPDLLKLFFAAMLGVERLNLEKSELQQQIQQRDLVNKQRIIIFLIGKKRCYHAV